ncbi:MAG: hypothetical protein VX460_13220 [Planctomycetota bacterium]|nr:hypothetical protein [Planctomycetota bacterium]
MNDPFEALAAMKAALEEGLTLLDCASVDDAAGLDALARITASIVAGPNPATLRAAVPEERLEDFDDQLEELLRLNAVLMRAAAIDKDQVAERLKSVRSSRRELGYYRQEAPGAGGRCDMSA